MQLTSTATVAIQLCLVVAGVVVLRGPRVARWLRTVLVGLGWLLLDAVLAPVTAGGQRPLELAPVLTAVAFALLVVALVATSVEATTGRSALRPGLAGVVVLATAFLLLPPDAARGLALVTWVGGTLGLGWTFRRGVRLHRGSLLEARLRLLAAAGWLLAASALSAVGGPRGVVLGVPLAVGTLLLLVAVAPPAFLRLAPARTRAALRRTDAHLAAIGPDDAVALQAAIDGLRGVLGGIATVLVDDGTVIGVSGPPAAVDVARRWSVVDGDRGGHDGSGDGGGDRAVGAVGTLATEDGTPVLRCSTRRGALVVVLPPVGVLLSADDREQVAAVAERFGLVLAREEARRADERAATSMRAAERMRDDMLSTLSHELRTPLTTIMGFAEVLRRHGDTLAEDQSRHMLARIVEKGTQLESIVSGLLDLTAVRGRSEPGRIAVYDLRGLVERACERARQRADRPVRVDGTAGVVHTDGGAVLTVLEELVDNACKFSPPDSGVRVVVDAARDGRVTVDVLDDGPGLGELGDRAFEPFVRGGDVLTRSTDGVGIGLTIARELARQLGGDLELLPAEHGAAVRLRMPQRHPLAARGDLAAPLDAAHAEGDPTLVPSGRRGSPGVAQVRGSG